MVLDLVVAWVLGRKKYTVLGPHINDKGLDGVR